MRTFDETVGALGAPVARVALDDWNGRQLTVARWRHRDAHVKISFADALRVALSLGFEQTLHHTQSDLVEVASCVPGDISLYPPVAASETMIEGEADVVQIFIDTGRYASPGVGGWDISTPLLRTASEDLRASAIALFVGRRGSAQSSSAAAMLRGTVHQILASRERGESKPRPGGLAAAAIRRVDQLIEARLDAPPRTRLNVGELADEAGLSPNHFIRAFRRTTGTTPYQYAMARRRQRAMALLRTPQLSIAEIGDALGFSSPAHFVAAFRQRFGTTPGDYRRAVLDPGLLRHGGFD